MDMDMNDKLKDIFGRRSIRVYQERTVDDDFINAMLRAAMAAPSTCAKDPWRYIVVRNKDTLLKITEGLPNGKMLSTASLGIVVCGNLDEAHDKQLSYMLQDCSASIENILLAAHILGLGACWLGVHPREQRIQHITSILSITPPVIPIACVAIGYPGEEKEPRTRYNSSYVHYEKW